MGDSQGNVGENLCGRDGLQSKLATFSDKVDTTLSGSVITFDAAKKIISEFLTSLQSDPSYINLTDQLTPTLSVIRVSSSGSGLDMALRPTARLSIRL